MEATRDMYKWVSQQCPICEKSPTIRMGRRGGTAHRQQLGVESEIWRCKECGLIFPHPMPIPINGVDQHYGVAPDDYFEHHDKQDKANAAAVLLEQAEALIGGKGKLLDIGAGRGDILRAGIEQGWAAVGIEPSKTFAEHAERHSGAEIRREPVEKCGFSQSSFDVVILGAVLEHLYNPDETIKEIARILRPGGALFLDVPNEEGLYFRVGNLYQKLKRRDWVVNLAPTFPPFHVFGFSPKSLRALLSKHGFRPEQWHVYGGTSWVPADTGLFGFLEQQAARIVTAASNFSNLGTYIETWAIKE